MTLHNATDAQLAAAVEDNLFALFRAMAALPGAALVEGERLSKHDAFPPAPLFKGVWRSQLQADEIDSAIEQTIAWFKARGAPLACWWFNQNTEPPALFERLRAYGFVLDYAAPGMALDLDRLDDALRVPEGVTIVEADDADTLADWSAALYGAYAEYGMPLAGAQAWADATLAFARGTAPWRLYVAYWRGQPVATNILFNGAGVAGLYCIGTIPEARGQGIGSAVTLKPLLDARAEGYHYGVLFASEMGVPVYQRLGFREVGITIGRYMWEND